MHHHHKIQFIITTGLVASTAVCLFHPEWSAHAGIIALSTNLIWIWSA